MEVIESPWQKEYRDLRIYEGATAFWIEHVPSGKECCMGDGVDMYWDEEGPIYVGTERFYNIMAEDLRTSYSELMEAYFPEEVE